MSTRLLFDELVGYFAPTVGAERSEELLRGAARDAGLGVGALDEAAATTILSVLSKSPGIVGIAARFATQRRARTSVRVSLAPLSEARPSLATRNGVPSRAPERDTVHRHEIELVLAATLDEPTARSAVRQYWESAGIAGTRCTPARALTLLDAMASAEGIVGVAASFAKARWHLRPK